MSEQLKHDDWQLVYNDLLAFLHAEENTFHQTVCLDIFRAARRTYAERWGAPWRLEDRPERREP